MENPLILHYLYHGYWWPGDMMNQGIYSTTISSQLLAAMAFWPNSSRMQCVAVITRSIFSKRHPLARPIGRGMGCLFWIRILLYVLLHSLQWFIRYHVALNRVITALDCIWPEASEGLRKCRYTAVMLSLVRHFRRHRRFLLTQWWQERFPWSVWQREMVSPVLLYPLH